LHFGTGLITTPADSSVTNAKLTSSVISSQSLVTADSSNDHVLIHDATDSALKKALYPSGFDVSSITGATALDAPPAYTDEFIISDAGTLKRLDAKHMMNRPMFSIIKGTGNTDHGDEEWNIVTHGTTLYDSDSCLGSHTFTPAVAGEYMFVGTIKYNSPQDGFESYLASYKNGSISTLNKFTTRPATSQQSSYQFSYTETSNTTDTFKLYFWFNNSGNANESIDNTKTSWFGYRIGASS
jgi:hypothetical protein